jgi:hypothetical protein
MSIYDPQVKIKQIHDQTERNVILSMMDLISGTFGFNFDVVEGTVVEIQMVAVNLTKIPRRLEDLPNLYRLQLQDNRIRSLQNIDSLKKVLSVNLSDNKLTNAAELANLPLLKTVDLSRNQFDSLESFNNLTNIEQLNLCYNQIHEIIPLPRLSRLKVLDLTGNPIETLQNIHRLENLKILKNYKKGLAEEEQRVSDQGIEKIKQYCRIKAQ